MEVMQVSRNRNKKGWIDHQKIKIKNEESTLNKALYSTEFKSLVSSEL